MVREKIEVNKKESLFIKTKIDIKILPQQYKTRLSSFNTSTP
jgi:hypothetical protein